jgi:hypothetical protein
MHALKRNEKFGEKVFRVTNCGLNGQPIAL